MSASTKCTKSRFQILTGVSNGLKVSAPSIKPTVCHLQTSGKGCLSIHLIGHYIHVINMYVFWAVGRGQDIRVTGHSINNKWSAGLISDRPTFITDLLHWSFANAGHISAPYVRKFVSNSPMVAGF